jgi:hypothetical protein
VYHGTYVHVYWVPNGKCTCTIWYSYHITYTYTYVRTNGTIGARVPGTSTRVRTYVRTYAYVRTTLSQKQRVPMVLEYVRTYMCALFQSESCDIALSVRTYVRTYVVHIWYVQYHGTNGTRVRTRDVPGSYHGRVRTRVRTYSAHVCPFPIRKL